MEQHELIARLNALTDGIEHAASMADWTQAARLAEIRSPLLMTMTANQPPEGLAAIRRIQASNERIFAEAHLAQRELADEYHAAMGRVQAVNEYHHMARL
ncbi:flagellar protein FliT [Burkholderia anthina]|uniref:flagellar protein FliT n=1 Tax=Burkholderia anthina TaxID=179879 RepID=UPI00158E0374|nr:flagellar protein FliT [Burkholderia anthina]QTD89682.1 flagellar protein FliT [Burkholderia anthina]